MNNYIKYALSFVLVSAGILILIFYSDKEKSFPVSNSDEEIENSDMNSETIKVSIDIRKFDDRITTLTKENQGQEKIIPFIFITSKTCPPCSDNIVEYSELLNDHNLYFQPTLVFVDEESFNVDRFLYVNDLQIPYVTLDSEYAEQLYVYAEKIVFIDLNEEDVFFTLEIPTVTVSMSSKKQKLNDIAMTWVRVFKDEQ